jgi:hypothetical protein
MTRVYRAVNATVNDTVYNRVVLELLAGDDPHADQAQQVGYLAALACRKYRHTAVACWLMIAGVVLLGVTGLLALVLA